MFTTRLNWLIESNGHCCFGIEELLIPLITSGLGAAGIGAETAAAVAPALAGAGVTGAELAGGGAALGALTGTGAGPGALQGGITGLTIGGLGPAIGAATGLGTTIGDIGAGLAGGALGGTVSGAGALPGALGGATAGLGAGLLAPSAAAAAPAAPAAAAPAAPAAAVGAGPSAATTSFPTSGGFPGIFDSSGAAPAVSTQTATGGNLAAGGDPYAMSGPPGGWGDINVAMTYPPSSTAASPGIPGAPTTPSSDIAPVIASTPAAATPPGAEMTTVPGVGTFAGMTTPGDVTTATDFWGGAGSSGTLGDIGSWIAKNPGILASTGLLGIEMMRGNQSPVQAQLNQLEQARTGAAGMATALQSPLFTGVLPPGAQGAIDASTRNAKAQIRSNFAKAGMAGSTSEAEAMTAVDQQAGAQKFGIENNLFTQAAGYANMSTGDLNNIITQKRKDDQQFNAALERFVASLGGARSGTSTPTA